MIYQINLIKYYAEIANKLNEMIPVEWEKIVMYSEKLTDTCKVCFYFYTNNKHDAHYSGDIDEEFSMDKELVIKWLEEVSKSVEELWKEFDSSGEKTWYTMTFSLDINWRFKVRFGYDFNSKIGDLEREIIWAYNELGQVPRSELSKRILDNYLKGQEENTSDIQVTGS